MTVTQKNIYLFQPQYGVEIRKENTYWLPYSAGCLWSYASQFNDIKQNFNLVDIIFRREDPNDVLSRLHDPVYCGFSCYVWNEKYCLMIAQEIKKRWPNCVIQFGGAQSSTQLAKHKFIDSIVLAEGEESFLDTLRCIIDGKAPEQFYQKKRLQNLDIPSPYTTGVFDKIISETPDAVWSMTFETNRGCPYACTFCDWGGITYSKVKKFDLEKIKADLEWAVGKPISYLFCADANFGIFKERDLEIAKMIRHVADRGRIDSVNLQYAKNSTDIVFEIAKTLGNLSRGITVSVQSMNDLTLKAIERKNMDINNIRHVMDLSKQHDILTYTEVILGLPLETLDSWKQGFSDILEMGQHNHIDMWFTQLLENSELNQLNSRLKYGIKSIVAKDYMPLYNVNDWKGIDEDIQLVNQTSTMTTEDLVQGYMYGWMIIQFHISGYSQIYAKYCRQQQVQFRQFYDLLFTQLKQPGFFQSHFDQLTTVVRHYLTTGEMMKFDNFKQGGHGIHALSYEFMYQNRHHAYELALDVANGFGKVPVELERLQQGFIFDPTVSYPMVVTLPVDIENNLEQNTQYNIQPKGKFTKDFDFYSFRRQGFIKNKITITPL